MTVKEIADRMVAMNREGLHMEIYEELFDPNVVAVEHAQEGREDVGFAAIKAKGEMWFSAIEETHSIKVGEPIVADKSFAVTFSMDVTIKEGVMPGMEGRMSFTELAVYIVGDNGKIIREEFWE